MYLINLGEISAFPALKMCKNQVTIHAWFVGFLDAQNVLKKVRKNVIVKMIRKL